MEADDDGWSGQGAQPQPGPVYDNALKWLAVADLVHVCAWLGIEADEQAIRVSESLPGVSHAADLVVQLAPGRLAQVEFARTGSWDVFGRMVEYRGRMIRRQREPLELTQHVVVLGEGRIADSMVDAQEFAMRIHPVYLRDQDPDRLLSTPSLSPLAVLARARGTVQREGLFRSAIGVIRDEPDPARRGELMTIAAVLAAIHLDLATIERAGREAGMPISLEGTQVAREIAEAAEKRGLERGLERGMARGERRGARLARRGLVEALLVDRFGHDPDVSQRAERLADSDLTDAEIIAAVRAASVLNDVDAAVRFPGAP